MSANVFGFNELPRRAVRELTELVRGQDQLLLERMTPIAQRHSLTLDFSSIRRIDAAGAAALVSLYCIASKAGHHFMVVNANERVVETLALVGLDALLVSKNANAAPAVAAVMRPFA
ncbi:MAG: lipid asymmetry maintenance protein MlaB [Terracidiphilus sp.]